MFFSSLGMSLEKLSSSAHDFKSISSTLAVHYALVPLAAILASFFLEKELGIGLIIAACAPSAMALPFLAKLCGGSVEKSTVLTVASNLASPVLMPLAILVSIGASVQVDAMAMAQTIAIIAIAPILLALWAEKQKWSRPLKKNADNATTAINFLGMWAFAGHISGQISLSPELLALALASFFICLAPFLAGIFLGKNREEKATLALSYFKKNGVFATAIAATFFSPTAVLATIAYILASNIFMAPAQVFLQKTSKGK